MVSSNLPSPLKCLGHAEHWPCWSPTSAVPRRSWSKLNHDTHSDAAAEVLHQKMQRRWRWPQWLATVMTIPTPKIMKADHRQYQIILKIVLQYFKITMSYFSCCLDTCLRKCLSEHLIYELTNSWLICFVLADTLTALTSRRHEPWYVRSTDNSGGYPHITPQK